MADTTKDKLNCDDPQWHGDLSLGWFARCEKCTRCVAFEAGCRAERRRILKIMGRYTSNCEAPTSDGARLNEQARAIVRDIEKP